MTCSAAMMSPSESEEQREQEPLRRGKPPRQNDKINLYDDQDIRDAEEMGGMTLKEIGVRFKISLAGAQIAVERALEKATRNAKRMGLEFPLERNRK